MVGCFYNPAAGLDALHGLQYVNWSGALLAVQVRLLFLKYEETLVLANQILGIEKLLACILQLDVSAEL